MCMDLCGTTVSDRLYWYSISSKKKNHKKKRIMASPVCYMDSAVLKLLIYLRLGHQPGLYLSLYSVKFIILCYSFLVQNRIFLRDINHLFLRTLSQVELESLGDLSFSILVLLFQLDKNNWTSKMIRIRKPSLTLASN